MIIETEDSIRSAERENRGEGSGSEFRNFQADHQVKQWQKFLCSSRNKQALIVFVTKERQTTQARGKLFLEKLFHQLEDVFFYTVISIGLS